MKNFTHIKPAKLIAALLAIYCMAVSVTAQSTNQSEPTQFSGSEYTGKGPNKETLYFFSFTGGPGEVSVRLEIKAKQYSTFARLEILDAELNTLATHNMNAATTSGSQQVLKKINLDEKQAVLLKVTLDSNLANYKIVVAGAVETASAAPTDTPPSDTPPLGDTGGGGASATMDSTASEAGTGPTASTSSNKFFNVDLGNFKLGQLINLPKGTLIIQMKDGSTQEIDMTTVKSLTIKKN